MGYLNINEMQLSQVLTVCGITQAMACSTCVCGGMGTARPALSHVLDGHLEGTNNSCYN